MSRGAVAGVAADVHSGVKRRSDEIQRECPVCTEQQKYRTGLRAFKPDLRKKNWKRKIREWRLAAEIGRLALDERKFCVAETEVQSRKSRKSRAFS